MRWRAAIDQNQPAIVAALRKAGILVHPLHRSGEGLPDLLVGIKSPKRLALFEIKDPAQDPNKRKLRPSQVEFFEEWAGFPLYVVETVDEALAIALGRRLE